MPLSLTLTAVPDDQPNTIAPARIGDNRTVTTGNLSIGRGPINDWVLVDPLLSKTHCAISFRDGRYMLTDLSTNGVYVNGARQRMAKDTQIVLTDGDSFALGGYMIEVAELAPARPNRPAPEDFAEGETVAPFARPRAADPFAPGASGLPSYLERGEEEDPLQTVPPGARRADPLAAEAHRNDDPFGAIEPHRPPPARTATPTPPSAAGRSLDPFDFLDDAAGHVPAPDAADLFKGREADPSWSGPSQRDDVDAQAQAFKAPKPTWTGRLDDQTIDDLLGDDFPGAPARPATPAPMATPQPPPPPPQRPVPPAPAAPPPASPFDEPALEPVVSRPLPVARQPATGTGAAPPGAAAPMSGAGAARVIAAFLEGAGVGDLNVSQHDPEAYMRGMGELMRLLIERVREVLMSRAEVKRELGVEQTMLRPRNNNALKFSITPEDAVAALLQPSRPGYLPPLQAAREALDDIGSHQVAVMAGVQTALFDLLKRFDPEALERRLTGGRFLDNIMPAARKARIWELFCATYKDIAVEAEEDFSSLFGREFARGYNEQVKKQ